MIVSPYAPGGERSEYERSAFYELRVCFDKMFKNTKIIIKLQECNSCWYWWENTVQMTPYLPSCPRTPSNGAPASPRNTERKLNKRTWQETRQKSSSKDKEVLLVVKCWLRGTKGKAMNGDIWIFHQVIISDHKLSDPS